MAFAARDTEFLELLTVVVLQGVLLLAAMAGLGTSGGQPLGLAYLAAAVLLGLMVLLWDHIPFLSHSIPLALGASSGTPRHQTTLYGGPKAP